MTRSLVMLTPEPTTSAAPPSTTKPSLSLYSAFFRTLLITTALVALLVVISFVAVFIYAYFQYQVFLTAAHVSDAELRAIITTGLTAEPVTTDGKKNILLLGTDQVANRGGDPVLTDTMLLISVGVLSGEVDLLPLPRDLWSDAYQTKINALYYYGLERYPDQPERFTTETIEQLTGIEIHHTVVMNMDQVSQLIDQVGGIEVDVAEGFTDELFPRSDVDIKTETDPAKLYETVTFTTGKQVMNGETALKYIRSRKSQGDQGTDNARSMRQEQVVAALLKKLVQPTTLSNPQKMGEIYRFYLDNYGTTVSPSEVISTLKTMLPRRNEIKIEGHGLSIKTDQQEGVLYHPDPALTDDQWTYIIEDETAFRKEVWQKLNLKTK